MPGRQITINPIILDKFSIRLRILVLILVAVLPVIVFIIYTLINNYNQSKQYALNSLSQYAEAFSFEQNKSIEAVRQLLIAFSNTPDIVNSNPFACNAFLKKQIVDYKRYANFGVADINGNIICSAIETSKKINIGDENYFKDVLQTKSFASGKYRVGKITGKSVLNFGYPLVGNNGNIFGVVFASLDLSWQNTFLENFTHDPETVLLVIDREATILSSSINADRWVGKTFPKDTLVQGVLEKGEGMIEVIGLDNIKRFYSFKKLSDTGKTPSYVVVGISPNIIYHNANNSLIRGAIALTLLIILIALISWKISSFLIIKRVEELQELDKLKSDFISIASHQLRTPPSAIKWFLEIISEEGGLNSVHKRALKNIGESNERMINLVSSLLNISRIENKTLKTELKPVSLAKVVREIMPEIETKVKEKEQNFVLELPTGLPNVLADEKLLAQVLLNLINNAIKYTPKKGNVSVSFMRENDFVICKIEDTGFGISDKEKKNVYKKFFRGDNAAKENVEGSGLGLYIVKSFIEMMNGKISFTSVVGKGTAFMVYLKYDE